MQSEIETISPLLPYLFSVGVPLILFLYVSFIRIPGWHAKLEEKTDGKISWIKLNFIAMVVAISLSAITSFVSASAGLHEISGAALSTGVAALAYVFVQSLDTDFNLRFSDRATLRVAIFLSFSMSLLYYLYNSGVLPDIERNVWIIAFAVASVLMFFPGMGESDARAISLSIAAAMPVVGGLGALVALLTYTVLAFGYIIYIVMRYRIGSIEYVKKLSIPAVPIIVLPFLIILIYASFDMLFGLGWLEAALGWAMFWQ